MSHHINEQILEIIAEDVEKMSTGSILQELEGGMNPGVCESWDMRVAMTDRNNVIEALIEKRFTEGY
ncbi:MAG: hypothetical protein EBX27_04665 [Proteobacteria bacterium]|nr:hypothetical protein [Pseudomonadota bacterium]